MGPSPEGEVVGDAVDHGPSQRHQVQHHRLETQPFRTLGSQEFKYLGQLHCGESSTTQLHKDWRHASRFRLGEPRPALSPQREGRVLGYVPSSEPATMPSPSPLLRRILRQGTKRKRGKQGRRPDFKSCLCSGWQQLPAPLVPPAGDAGTGCPGSWLADVGTEE